MRKIGRFTITRKLGAGGMGVVYAAHDPTTNRAVALKVLAGDDADRTDLRRFEREAWAAAQVKHPNTVAVLDAGEADGKPFIVMELVDGQTAGQVVDRRGPLPWVTATKVIISACKGLAAVHAAGLVHRDVKPGNVMVSVDGVVKLADFGLAKIVNRATRSLTGAGTVGTPHFMSPEQCHNEPVDGRTDIYALGATYYVMLTNATPYTGEHELQVMYAHCNEPVPDPRNVVENVPPGCAAVVRKAMAKSPAERYQSAAEMEAALDRVIASNGTEADPTVEHPALDLPPTTVPGGPVVPRGWLRDTRVTRRRLLLAIPAAGLIGGTAAVAWPLLRKKVEDITKKPVPPSILVPVRNVGRPVEAVAVSDDGEWLAVGMRDVTTKTGGVKLFDRAKGGAEPAWAKWENELVLSLAFSPDGSTLAVGGGKPTPLRLVNTADGEDTTPLPNADVGGSVRGVAFSPDGRFLAAAIDSFDDEGKGLIRVWDARERTFFRDLPQRDEAGRMVSFSWNSKTLATTLTYKGSNGREPVVELWAVESGEKLGKSIIAFQTIHGPCVAFARNVPLLAMTETRQVRFLLPASYDDTGRACVTGEEPAAVAIAPDGKVAAVSLGDDVLFWLVNAKEGADNLIATRTEPKAVCPSLAFTADGRTLVAGSRDHHVYEWQVPQK